MDYANLKKSELIQLCIDRNISNYSKLNIDNLIKLLEKNDLESSLNENTKISLKPLIKWSGGKSDEIKQFLDHIPKEYDRYLEPFIGGGSLLFHLNPKKSAISDVHSELIDFYNAIKNGKANEIYKFMEENPNTETDYYRVRDEMDINNYLDNAKRFYYLRKTCFRGMLRYNSSGKFNIPFGKYAKINYSDLLDNNYSKLLSNCEIYNHSFEKLFELYNNENNFMFLDPPYDSVFTDYGYCVFGHKEHEHLAHLFKTTKIRCLMIIGKTDFIVNLYKDYIVGEYEKKYRFKIHSGRIGENINTKHLIIRNY